MTVKIDKLADQVLEKLRTFFSSISDDSIAVALSGGLDSSVILSLSPENCSSYVTGIAGSKDLDNAKMAAQLLNRNCKEIIVSREDIISYAGTVMEIDPSTDKRDLGFETVLAAVLDNMEEKTLITGQGADEIFYGYSKFLADPGISNADAIEKLHTVTLPRENLIAEHFGKKLICPYLESGIMEISGISQREYNISGTENKLILRQVAALLGIPSEISQRKKKAAQYGSGFMKVLKKDLFPELRKDRK